MPVFFGVDSDGHAVPLLVNASGQPIVYAGYDGADYRPILVDNTGRAKVLPCNDGASQLPIASDNAGRPKTLPCYDGSNYHPILSDSSGRPRVYPCSDGANDKQLYSDSAGKAYMVNTGLFDGAHQRDPLRIGYSDYLYDWYTTITLPAGSSAHALTTVPAGEAWVFTNVAMRYVGTTPTYINMYIVLGAYVMALYEQRAPTSNVIYDRQGYWVVPEGGYLRAYVVGATLNDDFYVWATGFKFDTDQ